MKYVVILSARNEEDFICNCIESILNQTLRPEAFIIIDDDSMDSTKMHILNYFLSCSVVEIKFLKNIRYKTRGINLAIAYREAIKRARHYDYDYLLKIDADSFIPEDFVELNLKNMNEDLNVGITSGLPHWKKEYALTYITDGAIIYRNECLEEIGEIPLTTGFNMYMYLKAQQLGWDVKNYGIIYYEARRYQSNKLVNWYYAGMAECIYGYTLLKKIVVAYHDIYRFPYILGSLIKLLSYIIHRATNWRIFDEDYYEYMKYRSNHQGVETMRSILKKVIK